MLHHTTKIKDNIPEFLHFRMPAGSKLKKDTRVAIVMLYAETRNAAETVRQFMVGHGTLSPTTVLRTVKPFYDTGTTDDCKRSEKKKRKKSSTHAVKKQKDQ